MRTFKTLPPGHQIVLTEDGSSTLFSEAYGENCHSTTGAEAETKLHYLKGCEIETKISQNQQINILEVGFGLGVGFLVSYPLLLKSNQANFVSLEIDEKLLEWFRLENKDHPFLQKLRWVTHPDLKYLICEDQNLRLIILCGDARVTLPLFQHYFSFKFHAIYQDAFSPKKNPTLWTIQWFRLLKSVCHHEAILSTYSASSSIRKSLIEAGWNLYKGEKFGPKKSSTRAKLIGSSDQDVLDALARSPIPALSDDNIPKFLSQ